ncbi:MAG TPA: hypothetical protein VK666_28130 [Chryseolinea sp.]|nr:hypothetical protein [Chryseolinea sp.]
MKQATSILLMAALLSSCGNSNQSKALEEAKDVQSVIKPGTVATTAGGYTMTAKLDGKDWTATSLMPPEAAGRIIGYNNGEYIGLPYDRRDLVAGKKITFGEDNAVDLGTNEDAGIWGGRKGEMEIVKVDDSWAEGKFRFTATTSSSNKTVEVTDGFFRVPVGKNQ